MTENEKINKCSSCSNEISNAEKCYVNAAWKRAEFIFCKDCVTSLKAKKYAKEYLNKTNAKR